MNSPSSGSASGAYNITTGLIDFDVDRLNQTFVEKYKNSLDDFAYQDFRIACPPQFRIGNLATFTGFKPNTSTFSGGDSQFGSNPNNGDSLLWSVQRFKVGSNWYDDSFYLSDHRPVISDIIL
ncbi:unnamed protein product [Ambrosiozyma monospora]|uniref:Unnamed protein product n=1 Tax=Ambrosiozyma monospora TaxID=43982 RepID=A0ACB5SUM2_AMBMO|nr:unnamed protein product [Ambrosiozyma monospora]